MHRWLIDYIDFEGDITTREVSDPVAVDKEHFNAHCHLRRAERTFKVGNVRQAIDLDTGELIVDIRPLLGLTPAVAVLHPNPCPPPAERVKRCLGAGTQSRLRNAERRALQKSYRLEPIWRMYRQRLIDAFGGICANCGDPPPLDLDHHVPITLSGILAPGNIVPLCRRCNDRKLDMAPERFYRPDKAAWIREKLVEQPALMAFEFNWRKWLNGSLAERRDYLLQVGLDPCLVEAMFVDPNHPSFIGAGEGPPIFIDATEAPRPPEMR